MSTQFIKLSSLLLNTATISRIEMQPNKYMIHIIDDKLDGFWLFTNGFLKSNQDKYMEICKETYPRDYQKLTEWIDKIN
jgi:hypothetical protein